MSFNPGDVLMLVQNILNELYNGMGGGGGISGPHLKDIFRGLE